jgi:GT2 family glycosyltransferase
MPYFSLPRHPTVSFVVATHNRGPILIDCLRRTLHCGLQVDQLNIIVIDNASSDGTPELVEAFAREHARNLRLIRLTRNCGPVAKNLGINENSADILIVMDDDAFPLPGAVAQAIHHFQKDPRLGAAVFDVALPDGSKEASAYPDVFIGAGTAFRREALEQAAAGPARRRPGRGLFPADFFMQAEEYDLSFRLLARGWSVHRFCDMPLMHLKAPGARISQRTTLLDIRNNLWLLARYLPEPLCHQLAADWLNRYFQMARMRDGSEPTSAHRKAFIQGAREGLFHWKSQRDEGSLLLDGETIERVFKFKSIRQRLARLKDQTGCRRIAFGDWGKNMLAYWQGAREVGLEVVAIVDGNLAPPDFSAPGADADLNYRGVPVISENTFRRHFQCRADVVVITAMSPVHAGRRLAALQRLFANSGVAVADLFRSAGAGVQPDGAVAVR